MIEQKIRFNTGAGRGLGLDFARGEPSHIHLPRRRRVARPDDSGTTAPGDAFRCGDDEHREDAQPVIQEA